MQLDVFTVMVASGTGITLLGVQMLLFWSGDRRSPWLMSMAAALFVGAIAIALFIPRDRLPPVITMGLANALLISVFAVAWQSLRLFERRRPQVWPAVAAAFTWLLLFSVPAFAESMALRVIVASLFIGGFLLLGACELWRGRAEHLPSRLPALAVLTSFALITLMRIPLASYAPFPIGALPIDPAWMGAWALIAFGHVCSITMLVVAMTKERQEREQREFALSDPLTGLLNRRAFAAQAERMGRAGDLERIALLALDLDHFKQINDHFGHEIGDRVLMTFASVAQSTLRSTDILYRMGGEEFCFLLPGAGAREAVNIAESLRRSFEASIVDANGQVARTTVSIGVAASEDRVFDLAVLQGAADAALYEAKARGRNRIVLAGSETAPVTPMRPDLRQVS